MSSIREASLSLLMNLSSSLVSLHMVRTGLRWNLSSHILCFPNLQELVLAGNEEVRGELPKSNWSAPLRVLNLGVTAFSGKIPNSIGHLKSLHTLSLFYCQFYGLIPRSLSNLTQLTFLNLNNNKLSGEVPSLLSNLKHLTMLCLESNNFSGKIPDVFDNFTSLDFLDFSSNYKIYGNFPNSIFKLKKLESLLLSSTNLSGIIDFYQFSKLKKLQSLDLSNNNFLSFYTDSNIFLPNLQSLDLSSCNITNFPPFLARLQNLQYLNLSNNKINGKIPRWFSDKLLFSWKNIQSIDLSFNKLQGDLPIPPYGTQFFSVSNNNFTGDISSTLCNTSSLQALILSHNNLTGMIPHCLGTFPSLAVLDLQMNHLHARIPRNFSKSSAFQTIKLNGNLLEGPIPHSLAQCTLLKVLDLGDNNLEDVFPSWLENLQELQVLILRANKFHGTITSFNSKYSFPKLRIFYVSNNNFSGPLPTSYLKNFQGMMNVNNSQTGYMVSPDSSYHDSVVVTMKGLALELERILTTFTTIDLSKNMFEGEIPNVIGELRTLKGLNLSHNRINGSIPQCLGNLRSLEWLDLSWNQLKGEIPMSMTNLNFLSVLNLSQNQLEGIIPTGPQFNTFQNDSYGGNPKLCGFPLSKSCNGTDEEWSPSTFHQEEESGFGWKSVAVGYACGVVFGILLGCGFLLSGKTLWLARLVEEGKSNRRVMRRTNNRASANGR